MRRWVIVLVLTAVLAPLHASPAHADGVRYVDHLFPSAGITQTLTYGEAINSRNELQQLELDVYEGAGDTATNRALYIWVHGSGFRVGSRDDVGPLRDYARRGWVGMSIGYRLRPELPANAIFGILQHPESITTAQAAARDAQHDLQAAVRYARAHAAELRIDPDKIAVGGVSAGGITALAVAFNPNDVGSSGTPGVSSAIAAAVSHAGAYVPILQGAFPAAGQAPVAMYHGTHDEQVPFPTSPPGCVLTILVGNTCEYGTYLFGTHGVLGPELARDFLYRHVILGRSQLHTPLVTELGDPVKVVAGVEPANMNLGVTLGVSTPTNTDEIVEATQNLIDYALGALELPT